MWQAPLAVVDGAPNTSWSRPQLRKALKLRGLPSANAPKDEMLARFAAPPGPAAVDARSRPPLASWNSVAPTPLHVLHAAGGQAVAPTPPAQTFAAGPTQSIMSPVIPAQYTVTPPGQMGVPMAVCAWPTGPMMSGALPPTTPRAAAPRLLRRIPWRPGRVPRRRRRLLRLLGVQRRLLRQLPRHLLRLLRHLLRVLRRSPWRPRRGPRRRLQRRLLRPR